jgi:hypothetical protein
MTIEAKVEQMGLMLPSPLRPPGNFQLVKVHGGLGYIAGHGPFDGATPLVQGQSDATSPSKRRATPRG